MLEQRGNSKKDLEISAQVGRESKTLIHRADDNGSALMTLGFVLTVQEERFNVILDVYVEQIFTGQGNSNEYNCRIFTKFGRDQRSFAMVVDGKLHDYQVRNMIDREVKALVYPAFVREYELQTINIQPQQII